MSFLLKIHPQWPLRIGLGTMFLWSGTDMFRHPNAWKWAMPDWYLKAAEQMMPLETYFKLQGSSEVVLALLLLAWFLPRRINIIIAALTSIEIFLILALGKTGIDAVTFRDLGVLGAGLGLVLVLLREEQADIKEPPKEALDDFKPPPGVISGTV